MKDLMTNMPQSYQKHFGKVKLLGVANVKVMLPIAPEMHWELRAVVMEAMEVMAEREETGRPGKQA